jgi:cytoskeletal protein CcmA (bactofilin family)
MFAKKKDNTPAPVALSAPERAPAPAPQAAPQPPPRPRPASLIAQGVMIKGDITGDGELHLDCAVQGDVRVGKLVLGPNGRVEGSIYAQAIEIHGRVLGAVAAKMVRLYGTANVDGDITHEQLAMETGAQFQGRSLKFQRQATAPAPEATPVSAPTPFPTGAPIGQVYPG